MLATSPNAIACRKWRKGNVQKERNRGWDYYRNNRERLLAEDAAEYAADPIKYRNRTLLKKWGLTPEAFEALLARQGWKCGNSACGVVEPGGSGSWCVDHDHSTGEIRGLLCYACNLGLGKFKDDPRLLRGAIEYLDNPPARLNGEPQAKTTETPARRLRLQAEGRTAWEVGASDDAGTPRPRG